MKKYRNVVKVEDGKQQKGGRGGRWKTIGMWWR